MNMLRKSGLGHYEIASIVGKKIAKKFFRRINGPPQYLFPVLGDLNQSLMDSIFVEGFDNKTLAKSQKHIANVKKFSTAVCKGPKKENISDVVDRAYRYLDGDYGFFGSDIVAKNIILQNGKCGVYNPISPALLTDPLTGAEWNAGFRLKRSPKHRPKNSDIKAIWEMGRFHHLTVLGWCFELTGDEKFCRGAIRFLESFIHANPCDFGPHWANSMEVGIRSANWVVALPFFVGSEFFGPFFRKMLVALWQNASYIWDNLENLGSFTSNHYLADVAGLYFIAAACPYFKNSKLWIDWAHNQLECEITRQCLPDGWHFELSSSYQRFVVEIFVSCAMLGQEIGRPFTSEYLEKLAKMIHVLKVLENCNQEIWQLGDNDGGRFLCYDTWEDKASLKINHIRSLFYSVAPDLKIDVEQGFHFFKHGGQFVYREGGRHLVFCFGPKGQRGRGGHSHNDVLSFSLSYRNSMIFVDPGTYLYTGDAKERNRFRSIANHNTLSWKNIEPCRLREDSLFVLYEEGKVELEFYDVVPTKAVVQAKYAYHGRWHRRRIIIEPHLPTWLTIEDWCSHNDSICTFILGPDTDCFRLGGGYKIGLLQMQFHHSVTQRLVNAWYSPTYGLKIATQKLVIFPKERYLRTEFSYADM